jgi:hypothetical protein
MKNSLMLMICLAGIHYAGFSQPIAVEGVAEIQGKKVPAAVVELPYAADKIEDAIAERMAAKGHKGSKAKDYQLYRSVRAGYDDTPFDLYIKAERKSRKEKESSVVYLVLVKPNEIPTADAVNAAAAVAEGKMLLNEFNPQIEDYNLKLEIADQEELIKKLEKKESSLADDSADLVKKSKQIADKIQENAKELEQQRGSIEKQKLALEAIRARKRN